MQRGSQPVNLAVRHGADLAEILGDDQVGSEPAKQVGRDADDGSPRVTQAADLRIDRRSARGNVRPVWR